MSLIDQLASVRERAGLEPLPNPGIIQGFEPGSPPAPPYVPQNPPVPRGWVDDDPDDDIDIEMDPALDPPLLPSPLVPRRAQMARPAPPEVTVSQSATLTFQLVVGDRKAAWKNREVILTEGDEKSIRAIVLRAIQREVDAELAEVSVKRRRKPQSVYTSAPDPTVDVPAKRKPGRPKKNA